MYEQPTHVGFSGNQNGTREATMTTASLSSVSVEQKGKPKKGKRK